MMLAADAAATRALICEMQGDEATPLPTARTEGGLVCAADAPSVQAPGDPAGNAVSNVEPRDEFGRRKRR
jgi:hypothetical protein